MLPRHPLRFVPVGLGLAVLGFALALPCVDAAAGPRDRKVERRIGAMARLIDEMLVDSPSFLVRRRDNTRGTWVEGHGAVFTF